MLGSSYCDWIRESIGKLQIFSIQNDPSQLASSLSHHNPKGVGEENTRSMATMASVAGVACHQPKTTVYASSFHGSFSNTRKNSFSTYNSISFSMSISCKFQSKKSLSWSSSRCRATPLSNIRASSSKEGAEQTYIMIKPDGVQRGLVGEIISRFECKGFLLRGLKLFQCPAELAEEHYKELKEKPFYPKLVKYIISGPVVCMVWEGPGVVAASRKLIGVTNPLQAEPGTIRGDFGIQVGRNVVHGSDSQENGQREIALWFKDSELCEWTQEINPWLFE